jgi:murein DD-endopeptidase MepM/ murein hydrolase activator NlpD
MRYRAALVIVLSFMTGFLVSMDYPRPIVEIDHTSQYLMQPSTILAPITQECRLSSRYGKRLHPITRDYEFHGGVDLAKKGDTPLYGKPVYAIHSGIIEWAGEEKMSGKIINLRHCSNKFSCAKIQAERGQFRRARKIQSLYLHLDSFAPGIESGAAVRRGQIIGFVGNTGRSTGTHLDFRMFVNDRPHNPYRYFSKLCPGIASKTELAVSGYDVWTEYNFIDPKLSKKPWSRLAAMAPLKRSMIQ